MKNILFIAGTPGHLLAATSLIFEKFNESNGYSPYLLHTIRKSNSKFTNEIYSSINIKNYFVIDVEDEKIKINLKKILETSFERVFIFLEQSSLNVFLSYYYKKKGSVICLAPDGNKPYFSIEKIALKSRIKATVETYFYLFKRKLYYFRPYLLSWNYAKLSVIDEIWVTYPDALVFSNNKKVVPFNIMPNKKVINQIIDFFNVEVSEVLKENEGIIFYTNNILYTEKAYDAEVKAIKKIKEKYPNKPFYIKLHPATPKHRITKFKELGLICFCNNIPAELYIASLKNSIIIGFWSASQMIDNPTCKFYWLHKYLIKEGDMIEYLNLVNPTKHIIDIDNIDNIKF